MIYGVRPIMIRCEGGMGMPTYDYKCAKCRGTFAVEQSILDKPLKKCKACGGKLEKMLPKSVNLIFKGSGFYVNDYRTGRGSGSEVSGGETKISAKSKTSGKPRTSEKSGR